MHYHHDAHTSLSPSLRVAPSLQVAALRVAMRSGSAQLWSEGLATAFAVLTRSPSLAAWLAADPFFRRMLASLLCIDLGRSFAGNPCSAVLPPSRGVGSPLPAAVRAGLGRCLQVLLQYCERDGAAPRWFSFAAFLCGALFGAEASPQAEALLVLESASTALIMHLAEAGPEADIGAGLPGGSYAALSAALTEASARVCAAAPLTSLGVTHRSLCMGEIHGPENAAGALVLLAEAAGVTSRRTQLMDDWVPLRYCPLAEIVAMDIDDMLSLAGPGLEAEAELYDFGRVALAVATQGATALPVVELNCWADELKRVEWLSSAALGVAKRNSRARERQRAAQQPLRQQQPVAGAGAVLQPLALAQAVPPPAGAPAAEDVAVAGAAAPEAQHAR